ncbi:MAG: hypothetical protein Q9162_001409 [Coniocarpon cinnabarinum]
MDESAGCRSILYHDSDWTTLLLDIPRSIAEAQGADDDLALISCAPLIEPFQTDEPKSGKAKSKVTNFSQDKPLHEEIARAASAALQELSEAKGDGKQYCLSRVVRDVQRRDLKRKRLSSKHPESDAEGFRSPSEELSETANSVSSIDFQQLIGSDIIHEDGERDTFQGAFYNKNECSQLVRIAAIERAENHNFRIPPRSYCLLSKCESTGAFRSAAKEYTSDSVAGVGRFDVILIDPPWPNLSAKRKGAYDGAKSHRGILSLLLNLHLDLHVSAGGYVAIWTTNNPQIRKLILGAGGLFDSWNVELAEEWIWLKITREGEPVTPIEGLWRKPYESLLVGKVPSDRYATVGYTAPASVKRRVIAAVPDLHSRKPCLQEVFDQTLFKGTSRDRRVLEIFARHLVKGWMSWGNEVLKFNDLRQWSSVNR